MTQVQHNMNAINAYNRLNANVAGLKKASEKLASGYRINRAGDDAAGLAISEKMRSQIKGLNQAVRNSQDGINMIQTYEGAAQETHSILQRMKELAAESANGTYDNATDRAAIQLEFDQLNDELNQIADTDFNGTVVLNGGVMADGTVAKDGEFRYENGYTETVVAAEATDISGTPEHAIVDQTFYDKAKADAVYNALGVDVNEYQDVRVTFQYDGERWVADTVTDAKGNIIKGARASGLGVEEMNLNDNSGKGGFKVIAGKEPTTGDNIYATNAIFDEMAPAVKKGDTVTIQFQNSAATTYAPKNAGIAEDYKVTPSAPTGGTVADSTLTIGSFADGKSLKFELDTSVTDGAMSATMKKALDDLVAAEFEITFDGNAKTAADITAPTGFTIAADGTVTHDDSSLKLGKITIKEPQASTPEIPAKAANLDASGTATNITFDATQVDETVVAKGTQVTLTADTTSTTTGSSKWFLADGTEIMTADLGKYGITSGAATAANNTKTIVINGATDLVPAGDGPDANATGTLKFKVNVDAYNYADMSSLTVHAIATPKAATMASQVATPGVSQANSFKNSTGVLTYADNLTLQTGARTKDSVNFAFSYNTDGTADMGNLVANLDLSARSTGLNTANLSLADQKSANYAIDQIDKAINKTSMVRATFGSIQNRLEHKITNLTTTAENLTEAESSIRDTDMASEMMNYTKFNILQQAAQSMLAQANQQPQSILQLLG